VHIPDGVINGPTSAGFGVIAAGGVGVALRRTGAYLSERQVPLAGLVAAFVFAAQMFNFPVIGGLLAAVLVGPWAAVLVLSVVLAVQGLFFADGGLSALGLNIVNMGVIAPLGGYAVYRLLVGILPRSTRVVPLAAGLAAFASVVLAATGFVIEFAIGGTADVSTGAVLTAMLGAHVLIGIGEALLTALIVSAVMASRPDLVYGATAAPVATAVEVT
jgi:cobalt/nickel transport system permease protein